MINSDQLTQAAKSFKTNEATVLREYLQLMFLNALYSFPGSQEIVFKGGTAIHLVFKAPRFSEDLDFTVSMGSPDFELLIKRVFAALKVEELSFKLRPAQAGKRYLLAYSLPQSKFTSYINLDFSFREKVWQPQNATIKTDLPILFTAQIRHMSKDELYAEKIRAMLNRKKGRDLYDLWYLHTQGAKLDPKLVQAKLDYYQQQYDKPEILKKIASFDEKEFVQDLRPFVTLGERDKLSRLLVYIKNYLLSDLERRGSGGSRRRGK